MNFGCYHLERLKTLRGDQVAFYQWENRNGPESGLWVELQKTVAKRTRFNRLVARSSFIEISLENSLEVAIAVRPVSPQGLRFLELVQNASMRDRSHLPLVA